MKITPATYCSIVFFSIITLLPGLKSYGQNSDTATFLPALKTGFTENKGQVYDQFHKSNKEVKYILHTTGMNIQLRKNSFSYDTYEMISKTQPSVKHDAKTYPNTPSDSTVYRFHRVDISFPGSNPDPTIIPVYKSAHYITCYLPGNTEPIRVFQYQQIIYKDIYPGIDLVFTTGNGAAQQGFEYNFVVRAGADASRIRLQYKGATSHITNNRISIKVRAGQLEEKIPASFLSIEKEPGRAIMKPDAAVNVSYINHGNGVYGFRIPSFDRTKTLIIDPVPDLVWGTYYGGYNNDWAYSITRSPDGNLLVGGGSDNPNLATSGSYQSVFAGFSDAMLGKFDASGKLIWMTYYGGDQSDAIFGICTDKSGNIFAVGITDSKTGIATPGSFQPSHGNGTSYGRDAFLVKFNSAGNRIWSTYYGGTDVDYLHAVRIDAANNIFIAGWTHSMNAIATPGAFQTSYGSDAQPLHQGDALLAKFDGNGNRIWGTYYGGLDFDRFYAMDLDENGNIFASGIAYSSGLASPGAFQSNVLTTPNNGASYETLLVSFDNAGNRRWATYYGGNSEDFSQALTCDHENNVIIAGMTISTTGISTPGTYLTTFAGGTRDGFVAKFTGNGSRIWGTYYGGEGEEYIRGVTTDADNNVIITGSGYSTKNIATANSYQPVYPGLMQYVWVPFIVKLNKTGGQVWGTYYGKGGLFGGAGDGEAVVTDDAGNVFACGQTMAPQAIATCGAVQETWDHNQDMYVAMFSENLQSSTVSCSINTTNNGAVCSGTQLTFTAQVINGGTNPVYQWKVNGVIAGTNNSTFTASNFKNGDIVSCSVTANSNCIINPSANSNNITVSILPSVLPAISISQAPVGSICKGSPVVFTAVPGNQGTAPVYQWKINGIDAGTNSPVFSSGDLADGDIISCNLTNQFSCNPVTTVHSNDLTVAVTPRSTPSINIKSSVNSACAGTEVTFTSETVNGGINQIYQWMINGKPAGAGPNFSTSNLTAGDIVQCFLTPDISTCVVPGTEASNKIGIDIYPLPTLNITPLKPVIHRGDTIQLQVTGSGISSYLWTPPVNISDNTVANPYVWPQNSQEYTVTATSAKGCSNSKNILVEVTVDVHVPNAFSPNHDGKNDSWHISGLDAYPNCIVSVFNRWGQRVYYSTGYTKPWDGTFNNRELPSSSYVYVIDCKNGTRPISGTVTIIH